MLLRAALVRGLSVGVAWELVLAAGGITDGAGVGTTVEVNVGGEDCGTIAALGVAVGFAEAVVSGGALLGSESGSKTSLGLTGVEDKGVAAGEGVATTTALGLAVTCLKAKKATSPTATKAASPHSARRPVIKSFDEFWRRRTPLDRFFARVLSGKR